jgi:hypothetical protein
MMENETDEQEFQRLRAERNEKYFEKYMTLDILSLRMAHISSMFGNTVDAYNNLNKARGRYRLFAKNFEHTERLAWLDHQIGIANTNAMSAYFENGGKPLFW